MSRKKQARRIEAAVDDLASSTADKVAPLIHSAADAVESAADRVGPLAQAAADKVAPLAQAAAEKVEPYAHAAYETVTEKVTPVAQSAYETVAERVGPYAQQAAEKVAPVAKEARARGAHVAHDAVDKLGPRLEDARDRVTPVLGQARDRVQGDLLPKLADRLSEVADGTAIGAAGVEAQKRSRAAAAALRGELVLPEDAPRKGRWLKRLLVIAGVGGLAFVLLRKFLGGGDSDWQAARPTPYTSTTITEPAKPSGNGSAPASAPTAPGSTDDDPSAAVVASHASVFEVAPDASAVAPKPAHAADEPTEESVQPEADGAPEVVDPGRPSDASDDAPEGEDGHDGDADRSGYGDHAFIGSEPPAEYTIKANERSKKYHLPDSAGWSRTNTEVWFDSAEAAEAAGFTRAQH